ncbi:helix-turn-helix domain-containing protein, partial [Nocardioides sp.]|uniref:helix-turn-helix domain-containing protein n=1 Tax=Nocardioides sp. TaxID=35761 RepID=UPI0037C544FB
MEERRVIGQGLTQRQIAAMVGTHPSTISRELARSFSAPGKRSPRRAWRQWSTGRCSSRPRV